MQKRGCDDMHEIETNEKAKISVTISIHHFFLNWLQNKIPKAKSMYHFDNLIHDCFPWWHIAITSSEKFHGSWITPTNAKERSRGASLLMVMDGALLCSLMEQGNGLLSDWEIHLCAILPSWFLEKILDFVFLKAEHTCHCYWVFLTRLLLWLFFHYDFVVQLINVSLNVSSKYVVSSLFFWRQEYGMDHLTKSWSNQS